MERAVFDRMAEVDNRHWWYVARRQILADVIARRIVPPPGARILEIGCGTGHNFEMLGGFGHVDAVEVDQSARSLATARLGRAVGDAPLPALSGIADASYDLIALLDVLEHIEEDLPALISIGNKLAPGGRLLITVPANPWMWSAHDVVHHHYRRYTHDSLTRVIRAAGLRPRLITPFNTLLFPIAAVARIAGKLTGRTAADDEMPGQLVNQALARIFRSERHLVGRVPLPFGVSLLSIAERD